MKCVICKHGETENGNVTVTLEKNGVTIVVRNVPALVCSNCGEEYVNEAVSRHLSRIVERSVDEGTSIGVMSYKVA